MVRRMERRRRRRAFLPRRRWQPARDVGRSPDLSSSRVSLMLLRRLWLRRLVGIARRVGVGDEIFRGTGATFRRTTFHEHVEHVTVTPEKSLDRVFHLFLLLSRRCLFVFSSSSHQSQNSLQRLGLLVADGRVVASDQTLEGFVGNTAQNFG